MLFLVIAIIVGVILVIIATHVAVGAATESIASVGSKALESTRKARGTIMLSKPAQTVLADLRNNNLIADGDILRSDGGVVVNLRERSLRTAVGLDCIFDPPDSTDEANVLAEILRTVRQVDPDAAMSIGT